MLFHCSFYSHLSHSAGLLLWVGPRRGNFGVKNVKLTYFLKILLLYSRAWFRQTKYIALMRKEGSTKTVNFMTPWAGVLVLGRGHISLLLYSQELI